MDTHYINLVKDWVKLDNIIARNNVEVKKVKDDIKIIEERVIDTVEEKKKLEKDIIDYVQVSKLESMQLKISDGIITFSKKTTQKPMNQKWLREILQKYSDENPDENLQYNKLIEYVMSNIEKKVDYSINRKIMDQADT
jgi:CRISPR/Cas system CSM-associated protein Csm2 small subunit